MNIKNSVVLEGNLVDDPRYTAPHADGSKTVFLRIGVQDNFKRSVKKNDGSIVKEYATQFLTLQGFVPATPKNPNFPNGVYGLLAKGQRIGISGHMESFVVPNGATDKAGNPCNRWDQTIRIDSVQLVETKAQKADREKRAAEKRGYEAGVAAAAGSDAGVAAPAYAGEVPDDLSALGC